MRETRQHQSIPAVKYSGRPRFSYPVIQKPAQNQSSALPLTQEVTIFHVLLPLCISDGSALVVAGLTCIAICNVLQRKAGRSNRLPRRDWSSVRPRIYRSIDRATVCHGGPASQPPSQPASQPACSESRLGFDGRRNRRCRRSGRDGGAGAGRLLLCPHERRGMTAAALLTFHWTLFAGNHDRIRHLCICLRRRHCFYPPSLLVTFAIAAGETSTASRFL